MGSKITERITATNWAELRRLPVFICDPAWKRIEEREREMEEQRLRNLLKTDPCLVARQENGRIALFCKDTQLYRIIIEEKPDRLEIITFIRTKSVPRL